MHFGQMIHNLLKAGSFTQDTQLKIVALKTLLADSTQR